MWLVWNQKASKKYNFRNLQQSHDLCIFDSDLSKLQAGLCHLLIGTAPQSLFLSNMENKGISFCFYLAVLFKELNPYPLKSVATLWLLFWWGLFPHCKCLDAAVSPGTELLGLTPCRSWVVPNSALGGPGDAPAWWQRSQAHSARHFPSGRVWVLSSAGAELHRAPLKHSQGAEQQDWGHSWPTAGQWLLLRLCS